MVIENLASIFKGTIVNINSFCPSQQPFRKQHAIDREHN